MDIGMVTMLQTITDIIQMDLIMAHEHPEVVLTVLILPGQVVFILLLLYHIQITLNELLQCWQMHLDPYALLPRL